MAGAENLECSQGASNEGALRAVAERASFQAFISGYLREIDGGSLWTLRQWQQRYPDTKLSLIGPSLIELRLPAQDCVLLLDVAYVSLVGCHKIQAVFCRRGANWSRDGFWSALLALVKEIYQGQRVWVDGPVKTRQLELTYRLTDSLQNMIVYLRNNSTANAQDFIAAEQGLVFGHWMHPTPKSRQGILGWQHALFAPECHGEFLLHYFAVERSLVTIGAAEENLDPETIALEAADWPLEILQENEILVPCHPLQAQWLLARQELQGYFRDWRIRSLGALGRTFTATSSVRTVYRADSSWMFKFSIPVKITNSLRQNKKHELSAGLMMTRLCGSLDFFRRFPKFSLVADPAYMTLEIPGLSESGFEWIIRHNPFMRDQAKQKITLAALLQDGWSKDSGQSLLQETIDQQAQHEERAARAVAIDWFDSYWNCALEPLLRLLDEWGIALEAHQQNSVLDVSGGYPKHYYYRDNQGFYLARSQHKKLLTRLPQLAGCPELFYETSMLFDRFGYYLLFNQLFAVIARLGKDGYADEHFWLQRSREKFQALQLQLTGLGRDFIQRCLHSTTLPCKANLLTRVQDIDELEADQEMAIYVDIANPLQISRKQQPTAAVVEYA
jgi:siderophore synthetase component